MSESVGSPRKNEEPALLPSVTVPKGGGALSGVGEKFSANPVTGSGSMSVPLALSPGRAGFGPQLSLSYDSGTGNGTFGFGWSLSLPRVSRKTDTGLPQYRELDESDVFIISGAEDLVPVLLPDQSRHEDLLRAPGFRVHRYRPRVEGLFARIERWTEIATGDVHWRSITRDNVTSIYGRDNRSRIFDPAETSPHPQRVFEWLICESHDDKGNAVVYEYAAENSVRVDQAQAHERHRVRTANRYLKRIYYGNRVSRLIEPNSAAGGWLFEVVFDYGEDHYTLLPFDPARAEREQHRYVRASPGSSGDWRVRPDPFSSYRAGFEVRTYRRCHRVLVFHHFAELDPNYVDGAPEPTLVRATELDYDDLAEPNPPLEVELAHQGSTRYGSFLRRIVQSGFVREGARYLRSALPPLELEYSKAQIDEVAHRLDPQSQKNLPIGVDGGTYQWVDLDGEGLPGILSKQAGAWHYKKNLGGGRFDTPETLHTAPTLFAHSPEQWIDLSGDGQLDVASFAGPTPGFYERTAQFDWEPFRAFARLPNLRWDDPNLRFVDLTGDGHADVLITEDEVFTWYPSLEEQGFDSARRTPRAEDDEHGPRLVFSDGTQSVYLADMSGDGLIDLVRIRNGEACYWPSLGYGRFGAKISMDGAPWFDSPDEFDQSRIRLLDIDGSGPQDLVYFGRDGARLYFNQAGNRWSEARRLDSFPPVDHLTYVTTTDLFGNGTSCLVWSSALPGEESPFRYIDLMGGQKPHLLTRSNNQLGAELRITYAPSTRFYLQDKLNGRPWTTHIPFPVQVVERVESFDRISHNRFVSRFVYHDGYFDGHEREFRGFGVVEQYDTEELAALSGSSAFPSGANIEASSHVPPVLTRSQFHLGIFPGGDNILPNAEAADEEREARRALRGSLARREVYALDGSLRETIPYVVTEQSYRVRRLQPRGPNRHAVFLTHTREERTYNYERELSDPRIAQSLTLEVDDFGNALKKASIAHGRRIVDPSLSAEARAQQATTYLIYIENRVTAPIDTASDYRTPLPYETRTYELTGYAPSGPRGFFEATDLVTANHDAIFDGELSYEQRPGAGRQRRLIEHVRTLFRRNDLQGALPLGQLEFLALPFESYKLSLTPGLVLQAFNENGAANRVVDAMLHAADSSPAGGYVHSRDETNVLDDQWWVPSGRIFFSPGPADSAIQELNHARAHFFLPHRARDPFHGALSTECFVAYDRYDLMVSETRDALGNRVTVGERDVDPALPLVSHGQNYRTLQPELMMDPNRNRTAIAFDALGMVAGTALMGKPEDNPARGDRLTAAFRANLTIAEMETFFADPLGPISAELLGDASTRVVIDPNAYFRGSGPAYAATLAREAHLSEPLPGAGIQIGFSHSDGFGREAQKKMRAEPGPTGPRWVTTGWTIFNNKGKAVRQYEPYFSDSHRFELDIRAGRSPILFYDPLLRVVGTLSPNHTWTKVIFGSWASVSWDQSDTISVAAPELDPQVGDYFRRLPILEYTPTWHALRTDAAHGVELAALFPDANLRIQEERAARRSELHAGTPTTVHTDALGRPIVTVAHNRFQHSNAPAPAEELYTTRVVFDVEGNQLEMIDARARVFARYTYDMLGRRIHQASMEAGRRWTLADVAGKPLYVWDSRQNRSRTRYDVLQRPVESFSRDSTGVEILAGRSVYGEARANPEVNNFRGKLVELYDQAGVVRSERYDFKGNLLSSARRLAQTIEVGGQPEPAYKNRVDWNGAVALSAESYSSQTRFDALNRAIQVVAPHSDTAGAQLNIIQPVYNEANLLEGIDVWLDHGAVPAVILDPATSISSAVGVNHIEYDAKGRRVEIEYTNGASTRYTYDPDTFRLAHLETTESATARVLQSLDYVFDAGGNITHIRDTAQQIVFFANARVEPSASYTYDALSRLIEATGREHLGQLASAPSVHSYNDSARSRRAGAPHPNDGQALGRYIERYFYDQVGNIASVRHAGSDPQQPGWTKNYQYDEVSQLEPGELNNRLSGTTGTALAELFNYDAHGNMSSMPHLQTMRWNERDQLEMTQRQAIDAADLEGVERQGERTWHVYDAAGHRIRKITELANGQIKDERIYIGGFEVYRRRADNLVRETLHLMDDAQRVAMVETRVQGNEPGVPAVSIRYQLTDHLGSASLELDDQVRVLSYEEYTPYGATSYQAVRSAVQVPRRYRYSGKERDEESGLYYHVARFYAPWLGRWTSADPAGYVDGPNLYTYAKANPIRYADPNGTQCDPEIESCEGSEDHTPHTGPVVQSNPRWVTGRVAVTPEVAASILTNLGEGEPGFRPDLGRVGRSSWFISEGSPYTSAGPEASVQFEAQINATDAVTITSQQLTEMHGEILADAQFQAEMEAEFRQRAELAPDQALNSKQRKSLRELSRRAAESRMWQRVGQMVRDSASKVGEVILENSEFSREGNGRFVLTSDPARIQVQPEAVIAGMERAGLSVEPGVREAAEAAVEAGISEGRLQSAARVRAAFRIGGRVLLVVGAAYDVYRIYKAEDRSRTVTQVVGGWGGAFAAGGAFGVWFAPADAAGPYAWAAHGLGSLAAGAVGYWAGSEVADTIYEVVIHW